MKYCMHPQVQKRAYKNAAEVFENLDVIVSKMLNNFKFVTKVIPRKIIYFRDGVGDGQCAKVLGKELGALRKACYMASGGIPYRPQITFMSVEKRHKTRFFVKNSSVYTGKSGNCPTFICSHIKGFKARRGLPDTISFGMTPNFVRMAHRISQHLNFVGIYALEPYPYQLPHLAAYRVRCQVEAMPSSMHTDLKKLNERITRDASLTENFPMHFI